MCGRFYNHLAAMGDWVEILQDWPEQDSLSYNISPSSMVPIMTQDGIVDARWGMIPAWAKEFKSKYPTHNARAETVIEKPTFKAAWHNARTCIVPAGGYYEWKTEAGAKQPYVIRNPNGPLAFAGLWEPWGDTLSFTLLTTEAIHALASIHHRMPVMFDQEKAMEWLCEKNLNTVDLNSDVHETVEVYKVEKTVNNSQAEGPQLVVPSIG